ncbi:MAG: hypothetical protein Q7S11_02075 [bacterium]|nr:hypothetical protein [bacterium]
MNIQKFFNPLLAMQMYKEHRISQLSVAVYKWVTFFSVYIYLFSIIFEPAAPSWYDPFLGILGVALYGAPFIIFNKKNWISGSNFSDCYVILHVVSLANMFLASLFLIVFGGVILLPRGYDSYIFLQIVDVVTLSIGISTVVIGFLHFKKINTNK